MFVLQCGMYEADSNVWDADGDNVFFNMVGQNTTVSSCCYCPYGCVTWPLWLSLNVVCAPCVVSHCCSAQPQEKPTSQTTGQAKV